MIEDSNLPAVRRFDNAIRHFDQHNAADPNVENWQGHSRPRELVYAEWLTGWVMKLAPDASEALRLAARCQHIRRWEIPRDNFPPDRAGYLRWRAALKEFHARISGEMLAEVGYGAEMIRQVQELNLKRNFPHDSESRILEDALCLVFLEHQLPSLASKTTTEKILNALRKSWQKMTPQARELALKLPYAEAEQILLKQALAR